MLLILCVASPGFFLSLYLVSWFFLCFAVSFRPAGREALRSPKGGAFRAKRAAGRATAACRVLAVLFLPLLQSPAKTVRVSSGLNDMRLVGNPVQQGFAQPSIGYHLCPF